MFQSSGPVGALKGAQKEVLKSELGGGMEPTTMMAISGGVQAAGGFLQSYMQGKAEKERFEKEMKFRKEQFKQQRRLEDNQDTRSEEKHDLDMAMGTQNYNSSIKAEGRNDSFYLAALQSLAGG